MPPPMYTPMFQVTLSIYTIYNSLFRPFVEYGIAPWGEKKVKWKILACSKNVQLELLIMQKQLHIPILIF